MNRHRAKRLMDPAKPLFVTGRPFFEGDHEFLVGELFPWKELDLTLSQVQRLYRGHFVGHEQLVDKVNPKVSTREEQTETSPTSASGKRTDGPTIEEWVQHGYLPEEYLGAHDDGILAGYEPKESPGLVEYLDKGMGPWDQAMVQAIRKERDEYLARLQLSRSGTGTAPPAAPPASPESKG